VLDQRLTHRLSRFAVFSRSDVDHCSASPSIRFWSFVPSSKKHLSSVRQAAHGRLPVTPPVHVDSTLVHPRECRISEF
jgi:hypothetical protein